VGDFIAKSDIPWGGVNAYTRGQRVSADAVKDNGWEDLVVGENTREAREIKAEVSGRDISDFETKTAPARAAVDPTEKKG
jgi:hypothetical protein